MFARRFTKFIAVGATAIAIGGGAYGIVSATATTGSGSATTASPAPALSAQRVPVNGGSNARSGPAAGGSSGTVESVTKSSFTLSTSAGQKVTVKKTSSTKYRKGTSSSSASAITAGEPVLVLGTVTLNDHHGHAGHRAIGRQQRIGGFLGGRSGPVPAWCTVHVEAGRSDPGGLQPGVGDDRQRNGREQSD